jgi:hypothetical protein
VLGEIKIRLGLPCAECRCYYDANLTVCPVCNSTIRVGCQLQTKIKIQGENNVKAFEASFQQVEVTQ